MIRAIQEDELEESRRICFTVFERTIDGASCAAESAANIQKHPVTRMKRDYRNTLAWFDEQKAMQACVSHCVCSVEFDGEAASMAAVGDVAAMPCCQGKGVMKALFGAMLKEWHTHNIQFSYLYPFSGTYYGQFGYTYCVRRKHWNFPMAQLPDYKDLGTIELYQPSRLEDLKMLYHAFFAGCNLSVMREEIEWHHAVGQYEPDRDFRFTYLYYNEAGSPCGYLIYSKITDEKQTVTMNCHEFVYSDIEGLMGLIHFCKSRQAYYDRVCIPLPDFVPFDLLCLEFNLPAGRAATIHQIMHGMVRVVHAEEVLKAAQYLGNGSIRLFLNDSWLPANSGLWELGWKEGRYSSLHYNADGSETQADTVMDITLFSRLICRGVTEEELPCLPAECRRCGNDTLLKVFPKKKCAISDYF
ncbi:GNAT family N-acetyltransferase [Lacrimispora celerecrescens]|uniref:Putative acetyltransferase n=1 Tax=[Clostridium] celerecrescens 18A TaxID=1286362 RepID=A0A2M8Z1F0_9FIRM|nr:GNAT family N-acetyltransferase [Lacrimispora celerecrescens]PJJ27286.1 putative acetyltransferase [[Clostridium] celerecrescens 18A]